MSYNYDDIETLKGLLSKENPYQPPPTFEMILSNIQKRHFYVARSNQSWRTRVIACKHCGFLVCRRDAFERRQARHVIKCKSFGEVWFEDHLIKTYPVKFEEDVLTPEELEDASGRTAKKRPKDSELMSDEEEEPLYQGPQDISLRRSERLEELSPTTEESSTVVQRRKTKPRHKLLNVKSMDFTDRVKLKEVFLHYRGRTSQHRCSHFLSPLLAAHFTGYGKNCPKVRSKKKFAACAHCGLQFGISVNLEKARHVLVCDTFPHYTWWQEVHFREEMRHEDKVELSKRWDDKRRSERSKQAVTDEELESLDVRPRDK